MAAHKARARDKVRASMTKAFWIGQSTFLLSGLFMITINYQENEWGGNNGWGFLASISQYGGMLCFGWSCATLTLVLTYWMI